MAESNPVKLRRQLVENYDSLIRHLSRRLGSSEFAYEALHEAFVRLERVPDSTEVQQPADYIFRAAINIANNRRKAGRYRVPASEIDAELSVADEAPSPAQIAEAKSEFEAFERALMALPERCRLVVRMISLDGRSAQEAADYLGISVRTLSNDYRRALEHCAKSIGRPLVSRLGRPRTRG
ncbi:MAG: RNA polymerase sigma factor [Xanthobacteraceae bacterium]|nr:RNA polymerase sigma factor [Xanthobacteraceae bacterium]MBV9627706.1 RNA polymerase sigma factor [Xanthobacteraceae bacterium]